MGFEDVVIAIEGFEEGEMSELNRMRHLMWAPLAAMGAKVTPKEIMPLPIDKEKQAIKKRYTKEEFLALGDKYRPK